MIRSGNIFFGGNYQLSIKPFKLPSYLTNPIQHATFDNHDKSFIWYDSNTQQIYKASHGDNSQISTLNNWVRNMTGLTTYPTKKWIVWTDGEYYSINIGYLVGSGQTVFTYLLYPSLIQVSTRTR